MSQGTGSTQDKKETNSIDKKKKKCVASSDSQSTFHTLPYYKQYEKYDDIAIRVRKGLNIPYIEPNSGKYSPIPYIFRISDKSNNKCLNAMVRCPPFHVQLDHAIAVVWSMYSTEETEIPLGINQLQWAYSFLQNVKDKDSSYPRDVEHCMESISDEIIEQYADMAECISTPPSSMTSFNPAANSTKQDAQDKEPEKVCPCAVESSVRFADEHDACTASATDSFACKPPEYPFSVTYNDIRLHNRSLDDEALKKGNVCNNEKESTFLTNMRRDQLQKILGELDRLHSIEKYIVTTDKNFQPCLDESDQELKDFIAKKLEGCQNDECEGRKKFEDGPKGQKKEKKSTSKSSVACTNETPKKKDQGTQDEANTYKNKNVKKQYEEEEEDEEDDSQSIE